MNYWKRHIGDYHKDAGHLSATAHGIYTLLLDWYYANERPIPDASAARIGRSKRPLVQAVLDEFFVSRNDSWHHRRCDVEILAAKSKSAQAAESAKARYSERISNASETHIEGSATRARVHKPLAISQEKSKEKTARKRAFFLAEKPDDIPESVWADFQALREKKRAPLTQTALSGIESEAKKCGMSLADALSVCCQRGWQGFEAGWMAKSVNGGARQSLPMTEAQRLEGERILREPN